MTGALAAAVATFLAVATVAAVGPAEKPGLTNEGVGTYTDPSVANQISNFTINPRMVSCGVGTIANGKFSGPFAMLMYATQLESYAVDHGRSVITATGRMRSITEIADQTVEDVQHDFIAVAVDKGQEDRFDVHMHTRFWNAANPMCTRSTLVTDGCRFGGELMLGDVVVSHTAA